jgi:TPP-dependent pyruvate/acetoin dehydrogenase alpha subunit
MKTEMVQAIDTEIAAAIKFAEAAPHPDPEDLYKHVFA